MAGRGLVSILNNSRPIFRPPKVTSLARNTHIKSKCNNLQRELPVCENPCLKKCRKPYIKRIKPCPKRVCLPPVHMCPYDDPCFHCPYTPPPCPKRKDPCCRQPCCPPYNPYKYRDICCLPLHPDRLVDPKCPSHCKVKRKECCPCCVCNEGPLKCERQHNFSCCPAKPPAPEHCCARVTDKKACPTSPDCRPLPCDSECTKIPCPKQRGSNSCDTTR